MSLKTEGVEPESYNPAKDYAKLRAAAESPLPFDGWPSRWKRCLAAEVLELRTALTAEAKRLDWLERNHTLHNSVAILYVVDGYEVQFSTQDGNNLVAETHGETLRDAIDKCMEEVP